MNKAILMGRIVKEGELKYFESGNAVLNTSLATNRKYKDKQGKLVDEATFHNITLFGKQAENFSQYVKKGQQILVEGTIQNRSREKDGVTTTFSSVLVDTFHFISQGSSEAGSGGDAKPSKPAPKAKSIPDEDFDDQIPF